MLIRSDLGEAHPLEDEADIVSNIIRSNIQMIDHSSGCPERAQHAKLHGWVKAELSILNVPQDLQVGLFAKPLTYEAIVRFSNGAKKDDREEDAHGMAIRVLGVAGARADTALPDLNCVDLILLDNETFLTGDLHEYDAFNDLMGEILDAVRNRDKRLHGVLNALYLKFIRKFIKGKDLLGPALAVSDQQPVSPIRSHYWSTTPYLLKNRAVKYALSPIPRPSEDELTLGVETENGLGETLNQTLPDENAVFDVFLEVQNDATRQPVEDPTIPWSDGGCDRHHVATLKLIAMQPQTLAAEHETSIAFNPWNTLADQRPLGAINRIRGAIYRELAAQRVVEKD